MFCTWSWEGDDKFVAYDADVSFKIEAAYQRGDSEFDLAPANYLVDFRKLVQRRKDDRSRRRAVEREPGTAFFGQAVCLASNVKNRAKMVTLIGGCDETLVLKYPCKEADYVVVGGDWEQHEAVVDLVSEARHLKIPILLDHALEAVCEHGKELDKIAEQYRIVSSSDSKANAAVGKRLRDEAEAEAEKQSASKLKKFETETHIKSVEPDERESTPPLSEAVLMFAAGAEFVGTMDDSFSISLNVNHVNHATNEFTGTLNYVSMNARTSIRGTVDKKSVVFVEEDALFGEDAVECGSIYKIIFHSETDGKGTYKTTENATGIISLHLARTASITERLKVGTYSGILYQPVPMTLTIESDEKGVTKGLISISGQKGVPFSGTSGNGNSVSGSDVSIVSGPGGFVNGLWKKQRFHIKE